MKTTFNAKLVIIKDIFKSYASIQYFKNFFAEKLYSWGIRKNVNKDISVTDWPSE